MVLSDRERAQLETLMQKEKEVDPDENTLIEIQIEDRTIRIPYKKAKPWLKKQGIDLDDILEEAAGEDEGEEGEEEEEEFDPEAEGEVVAPKVRKRPAKKAAAATAPPGETVVAMRGKSYWKREA
jgi:hypothetical protein